MKEFKENGRWHVLLDDGWNETDLDVALSFPDKEKKIAFKVPEFKKYEPIDFRDGIATTMPKNRTGRFLGLIQQWALAVGPSLSDDARIGLQELMREARLLEDEYREG